jgi:multiple sugar transport system permease protein
MGVILRQSRLNDGTGASLLERHFPLFMSLPAFVVVAGVTVVPIAVGIAYSFTTYNLDTPAATQFYGLGNYTDMLGDPSVPQVMLTTLEFVAGSVIFETVGGLLLALLLARPIRGIRTFRLLYTMPLMTAGIAIATTFRYLFNLSFGWINWILGALHLPEPTWISQTATALPSVIIADSWSGIPLMALLILAGLLGVSQELIDAAKVDGATAPQVFRYITLPSISPVLTIGILFQIVNTFRRFELIQVMTDGGPGIATTVLNYYIYQMAFYYSKIAYASALALLLLACVLASLIVVFALSRIRR